MQNLFRGYKKLAGMTGTANTEADEFNTIYNLQVTVVPPNRAVKREDASDVVFKTDKCGSLCILLQTQRGHWVHVTHGMRLDQHPGLLVLCRGAVSLQDSHYPQWTSACCSTRIASYSLLTIGLSGNILPTRNCSLLQHRQAH